MQPEKPEDPVPLRPVPENQHQQLVDALRDLLIASDPYNQGDPVLASAYHQARLVLAKHM